MSLSDKVIVSFTNAEKARIPRKSIHDPPESEHPRSLKKNEKVDFLFNRIWYTGSIQENWISRRDIKVLEWD